MYVSTSWNRVYAVDAATGKKLWQYVYEKPKKIAASYAPWNRGVALGPPLANFQGVLRGVPTLVGQADLADGEVA